jgi:hypothetical protein
LLSSVRPICQSTPPAAVARADNAFSRLQTYIKATNVFVCPDDSDAGYSSYAMNAMLLWTGQRGIAESYPKIDEPAKVVGFFDWKKSDSPRGIATSDLQWTLANSATNPHSTS